MEKQVFILTKEKKEELEAELAELKGPRRKEVTLKIKEARAQGDLSENAEYSAAREEQGHIEGRIEEIETILKNVQIIETGIDEGVIKIGSTIRLAVTYAGEDEEEEIEYTIVGSTEADPRHGRLSNEAPLAQQLIGKKAGEKVSIPFDGSFDEYRILEIK